MTTLFLSYARADDEPFVRRLHADLTAEGFDTWFDKDDLRSRGLTFHQEIKDAIRSRDRLIYIGGPKAAASLYVREEWQLAITLDKMVIPILRRGEYETVIPGSLALLHCDDFRDDAQYPVQLAKLIVNLKLPPPPLGELFGDLPQLPKHFQARPELLRRIKDALLVDLQRPIVVTGAESRVGMQGMGGIGKSVLAAALARDQEIRRSYPDGVIWVRFGKTPKLEQLQRNVVSYLGGSDTFTGEEQGKSVLRELLRDKAVVFVLDDLWDATHVANFAEFGPRCRALITTRDVAVLNTIQGTLFQVQLFSEVESLRLLAESTGVTAAALPAEAREVARECGNLPLALALCAGMTRQRAGNWKDVLTRLRRADLKQIEDRQAIDPTHRSIWTAMHASVKALSKAQRRRFAELSVFGPRGPVPSAAVQTLWGQTGQLDDLNTDSLLVELRDRSLVQLEAAPAAKSGPTFINSAWNVSLHDLLYDYAHLASGDSIALHHELLKAYRDKCPAGWWTAPNDGYFLTHLRDHLLAANRATDLADLLHELRWLETKNEAGLTFDLTADFATALKSLPTIDPRHKTLRLLDEALRRDIHFIARHFQDYPQALFQCLWNSCWWYDCPDAAKHYIEPLGGWTAINAPWLAIVKPKLCELLQMWKNDRQTRVPNFPWLPSNLPPPIHLGSAQRAVFRGHEFQVWSVATSPDGNRIASADGNNLRVWDRQTGAELLVLKGHRNPMFCRDGQRIVSTSEDETVVISDAQTGKKLQTLKGHTENVTSVANSLDGRHIVSASSDGTVRVWDSDSGLQTRLLSKDVTSLFSIAISPDGRRIASGLRNTVHVWDADSGAELCVLRGHSEIVRNVAFSPNGLRIFSGSNDGTIRIWDAETGAELHVLRNEDFSVESLAISPDGRLIASGWFDFTVRLWDAESGTPISVLLGHEFPVRGVAFSPNGRWIVSGGDSSVRIWELNCDAETRIPCAHEHDISAIALSPDGRRIATGSFDHSVQILDYQDAALISVCHGHQSSPWDVVFSSDGRRLASGSTDRTVRVWDVESGSQVSTMRSHEYAVRSVAFSPDGKRVLSGAMNAVARVSDAETGAELSVLIGHEDAVHCAAFSPDGQLVVTGSFDTLRIWNSITGEEQRVMRGHTKPVTRVVFSSDARQIVSTSYDDTVRVWDAINGNCLKIIEGIKDAERIALTGGCDADWMELVPGPEPVLLTDAMQSRTVFFGEPLDKIIAHRSGRAWAAERGGHLYLLRLEGDLSSRDHPGLKDNAIL